MVILLTGASHGGKTLWAQRMLEKYGWPYLSIDHLKMGLIRSGLCPLTPESPDEELTEFLWLIVEEMIKTAVENDQNLIVEGCYVPFDWKKDFAPFYLDRIKYLCLVFSRDYIELHFDAIKAHANDIEQRLDDSCCTREYLLAEHELYLAQCQSHDCPYLLIDEHYPNDLSELNFCADCSRIRKTA